MVVYLALFVLCCCEFREKINHKKKGCSFVLLCPALHVKVLRYDHYRHPTFTSSGSKCLRYTSESHTTTNHASTTTTQQSWHQQLTTTTPQHHQQQPHTTSTPTTNNYSTTTLLCCLNDLFE